MAILRRCVIRKATSGQFIIGVNSQLSGAGQSDSVEIGVLPLFFAKNKLAFLHHSLSIPKA